MIEAELGQTPRPSEDDPRLPANVEVFAVRSTEEDLADDQKNKELAKLLDNYADEPIRGIDPTKYQPPSVAEGASVDDLLEAERRGRLGEGHMALRYARGFDPS